MIKKEVSNSRGTKRPEVPAKEYKERERFREPLRIKVFSGGYRKGIPLFLTFSCRIGTI